MRLLRPGATPDPRNDSAVGQAHQPTYAKASVGTQINPSTNQPLLNQLQVQVQIQVQIGSQVLNSKS